MLAVYFWKKQEKLNKYNKQQKEDHFCLLSNLVSSSPEIQLCIRQCMQLGNAATIVWARSFDVMTATSKIQRGLGESRVTKATANI